MQIDAEKAVLETERRWVAAHRTLDLSELAEILDEAYRHILPDGRVVGKAELLASYGSGRRRWDVAEGSDYHVQVYGRFAVVVGTWHGVGENHGEAFDYRAPFLAVYLKRDTGWKLYRDETFDPEP